MSTFNVERFKSSLTNGGARPNQFMVQLSFPTYVAGQALAVARAPFLVSVAELPGQTVNPAIVQYRGREVKLAGERTFDPWTITIINDTSMKLRQYFERWSDAMNNRINNGGLLTPAAYQCE